MDKKIEILLNSKKNINSVNVDTYDKFELTTNVSEITEYDARNVLSATDIFDVERESNESYRIYGKIQYLSLLNGLKNNYDKFDDFFLPQSIDSKNIVNSFNFYLVKPTTEYTQISETQYVRFFEVITTSSNFELYTAGFSNNVFGEQDYAFNFNVDVDISNYFDEFGFPITELYLYAKYKLSANEYMFETNWGNNGTKTKASLGNDALVIGDRVYGDLIEYSKLEFTQTQISEQIHYITTTYSSSKRLQWKYNPFTSFRLRYLSNELYKANINSTSYDLALSIPDYATEIDNDGNYVWRIILPQGYIDPLIGIGVDYPFLNKKRYLFSNTILSIVPDLDDLETLRSFNEIWFSGNSIISNIVPIGDSTTSDDVTPPNGVDNIGKPCQ